MNTDYTVNGDFRISGGPGSVIFIPVGVDIYVTGDMGNDDNNGVIYHVNGTLHVEGTLYGKNDNSFTGTGQISGGSLDVKNGASCGTPCPVYGGFDDCDAGNGGGAALCTAALPVTLLYFNISILETSIGLKWATSMEENFYKFFIQRSPDGQIFSDIGEVEGRGFDIHDIESKYSFVDEAPLVGVSYYRLKAVDLDETFEYFPVKMAELHGPKKIAVYPNPSSGHLITFRTNFNASENDRVLLIDQLGVEIFSGRVAESQNSIAFQNTLRPGVYMLRYVSDGFEQVTRIVIKN